MIPIVFRPGRPQQEFANGILYLAGEGEGEAPAEVVLRLPMAMRPPFVRVSAAQ